MIKPIAEVETMRVAGRILAKAHEIVRQMVESCVSSLELDTIA